MSVFETIADFVPVWIPTSERLPEIEKYVLVTACVLNEQDEEIVFVTTAKLVEHFNSNKDEYDGYIFYEMNSDGIPIFGDITAWMPLPSPYKAKRDNDGE